MKSMIADITDSTNMPQAYGYVPFAWQIGIALGWVFMPATGEFLIHRNLDFADLLLVDLSRIQQSGIQKSLEDLNS